MTFDIDPDIRRAWTPPAAFYRDPASYDALRERVLSRGWLFVGDVTDAPRPGWAAPKTLLPGCLDEPVALTRDHDGVIRCISNVCTHRGNLVVGEAGAANALRCRYHGRTFGLDGAFRRMPGFDDVESFPSPRDCLPQLTLRRWGPLLFASLDPAVPFDEWIAPIDARLAGQPIDRLARNPAGDRTFEIPAHWTLYVDNYLEGFHIPYVHHSLAAALDVDEYRDELFDWANLQLGVAEAGDDAVFTTPRDHPDHGTPIAAWYFWLFPTTMLNFYPWGLSLNVVEPRGPRHTAVHFKSYVWDASKRTLGAGADLDRVEAEDEEVVTAVQRGIDSRLYDRGRYSPEHERCVHHFHRLLAAALR